MNEQKTYTLRAEKREIIGKKVKTLREKGLIPAVIYGHDTKPQNISLYVNEFAKTYSEAGTSSLVDLSVDSSPAVKVLTREPQLDPVKNTPIHIDFYKVRMDKKIKTEIPLEFIGTSEAVEQLDGSLVTNRDSIEVECLPADLVPEIKIDISSLKSFEENITISDIKVPSGIEVLNDPEEVVALVEPPRSEEELAELEESAAEEEKEAIEQMEAEGGVEKVEEEKEEAPAEEVETKETE